MQLLNKLSSAENYARANLLNFEARILDEIASEKVPNFRKQSIEFSSQFPLFKLNIKLTISERIWYNGFGLQNYGLRSFSESHLTNWPQIELAAL